MHQAGNGKWLIHWAVVEKSVDGFKGKKVKFKYIVSQYRALTDGKPTQENSLEKRLFLARQNKPYTKLDQRFTKEAAAVSKANGLANIFKNRNNAEFIYFPHEVYGALQEVNEFVQKHAED